MIYLVAIIVALLSFYITDKTLKKFSNFVSNEEKKGKEKVYQNFPKRKKPLGGGVAILITLICGCILIIVLYFLKHIDLKAMLFSSVVTFVVLIYSLIGYYDDSKKAKFGKGASEKVKLAFQIIAALGLAYIIALYRSATHIHDDVTTVLVPFVNADIHFGWLFIIFVAIVLIAASNSVNLTDGLDGLAGASVFVTLTAYLILSFSRGFSTEIPTVLPLVIMASMLGFLWYNKPKAKIIMGDTGALGLGGGIGAIALLSGTEWLLLAFATPFIINTLSVIFQVGTIKFYRGPVKMLKHLNTEVSRPFICTPLHHHFQSLNWKAEQILMLFISSASVSAAFGLVAAFSGKYIFWILAILVPIAVLIFANIQKSFQANFFLGVNAKTKTLELYKGAPVIFFGVSLYKRVRKFDNITTYMLQNIAADGLLWRNFTELDININLGQIFYEQKMFDEAAQEWQKVTERNLIPRHNIVVKLGKIYYRRGDLLLAIKLWQKLPNKELRELGLIDTIRQMKIRLSQLADSFYASSIKRAEMVKNTHSGNQIKEVMAEVERAISLNGDLRELIKDESIYITTEKDENIYNATIVELSRKRDDLHSALTELKALDLNDTGLFIQGANLMQSLSNELSVTESELLRLVNRSSLDIKSYKKIYTQSRNLTYRVTLGSDENIIFKVFCDERITFYQACYNRERGVMKILNDANAKTPKLFGGIMTGDRAILAMSQVGYITLADAIENGDNREILLNNAIDSLIRLKITTMPITLELSEEINKVLKEKLTEKYYLNALYIALNRLLQVNDTSDTARVDLKRLEEASFPLINALLSAKSGFIHFEFVPKNLVINEKTKEVSIIDFEQATIGPYAFDLATLLYNPSVKLNDYDIAEYLTLYNEKIRAGNTDAHATIEEDELTIAAIFKLIIYSGSAANFYRRFSDEERLKDAAWYIRSAKKLLQNTPYHSFHLFLSDFIDQ